MKQDFPVTELPLYTIEANKVTQIFSISLSKIASPRILGGRVNQTDVSNTNVFTPPSTPVNLEKDQP